MSASKSRAEAWSKPGVKSTVPGMELKLKTVEGVNLEALTSDGLASYLNGEQRPIVSLGIVHGHDHTESGTKP